MNRWVRLGLQTAFGLALLWLWLRTVSLPEVAAHARVQSWWAVGLMIALFLITSLIRARRWLLLLRPLAPVGMVRAFAMNAAGGLLNYVLPIRSGDAARAWWLWRRHRVPAGSALATIVIDKACDLAAVALFLAGLEVVALSGAVSAPRGLAGAAALAIAPRCWGSASRPSPPCWGPLSPGRGSPAHGWRAACFPRGSPRRSRVRRLPFAPARADSGRQR